MAESNSNVRTVDFSRASRKESLRVIHGELTHLSDDDLARVAKLLKAEQKARTALQTLQAEIESDE